MSSTENLSYTATCCNTFTVLIAITNNLVCTYFYDKHNTITERKQGIDRPVTNSARSTRFLTNVAFVTET